MSENTIEKKKLHKSESKTERHMDCSILIEPKQSWFVREARRSWLGFQLSFKKT